MLEMAAGVHQEAVKGMITGLMAVATAADITVAPFGCLEYGGIGRVGFPLDGAMAIRGTTPPGSVKGIRYRFVGRTRHIIGTVSVSRVTGNECCTVLRSGVMAPTARVVVGVV